MFSLKNGKNYMNFIDFSFQNFQWLDGVCGLILTT